MKKSLLGRHHKLVKATIWPLPLVPLELKLQCPSWDSQRVNPFSAAQVRFSLRTPSKVATLPIDSCQIASREGPPFFFVMHRNKPWILHVKEIRIPSRGMVFHPVRLRLKLQCRHGLAASHTYFHQLGSWAALQPSNRTHHIRIAIKAFLVQW
jgi:hypothetical protein